MRMITEAVIMMGDRRDDDLLRLNGRRKYEKNPYRIYCWDLYARGKRMGHAGALINKNSEKADAKLEAMESAGIIVTEESSSLGITLKQSYRKAVLMFLKIMFLSYSCRAFNRYYLRY